MAVKTSRHQALYKNILDQILSEIKRGTYKIGDFLPPEPELAIEFGVSRSTIRKALQELRELGVILQRKKAGTQIIAEEPVSMFAFSPQSTSGLLKYLEQTDMHFVSERDVPIDEMWEIDMDIEHGRWKAAETYRTVPGTDFRLSWTEIFVPEKFSAVIPKLGKRPGLTYLLFDELFGEYPAIMRHNIAAASMPSRAARVLGTKINSPAMRVTRKYINEKSKLIQIGLSYYPEGRFSYSFDLIHR